MKLNYKRTFLVGLAFFAISTFWQLYDHIVPLMLKYSFHIADGIAGGVMAADNILALFLLPLVGALSDKTNTRWGRRMPYIVVGSVGGALTMLLLPLADRNNSLPLFVLGLALALLFMATYRSPAVALMPDVTIKPLRSKGNAIINLMGALGGLIILLMVRVLLPSEQAGTAYRPNYLPIYLLCAGIMLASTLVLVLFVREPRFVQEMKQTSEKLGVQDEAEEAHEQAGNQKLEKDVKKSMGFLLASVALWFMGYNAITTAFSKYCVERFQMDAGASATVLLIANAAAIISFIPVGMLATKIGRRKCILGGLVLLCAAFATGATFSSFTPFMYVLFVAAGIAWAGINVNSYPMVVEMARGAEVGKFTGYYYTASMSAQTITPILSGTMLQYWGYKWLFPYGALFVGLAFITMQFVKHGDAKPIAPKSKLEAFEAMED
ncbi:MAG: MFS transporter [Oscillospiraceae bacterium]